MSNDGGGGYFSGMYTAFKSIGESFLHTTPKQGPLTESRSFVDESAKNKLQQDVNRRLDMEGVPLDKEMAEKLVARGASRGADFHNMEAGVFGGATSKDEFQRGANAAGYYGNKMAAKFSALYDPVDLWEDTKSCPITRKGNSGSS